MAARPSRGAPSRSLGLRPPMGYRPGAARPSRVRLSRCLRSSPATRSSPAGVRGAVAHPGPRGGRPAAPCPLSQGAGLRGGALKFCSPHTPPISRLASRGAPAALGSGMRLPVRSRPVSALRVATLAPRGVSWFVPTPRASRRVPLEHRAYRQPPSVCPSALTRHAARCPRPQVLRLGGCPSFWPREPAFLAAGMPPKRPSR